MVNVEQGIVQWLEHQTCDRKVIGLNPCMSGRRIFFSMVNCLCWLLFQYLFHPHVTMAACKITRPSAKSAGGRLQLNKHVHYICGFEWSDAINWCMVVWCTQNIHWDSSSFMRHQPKQCCKHTTSVEHAIKSLVWNHLSCDNSAVSLLESGE